jgi:hypothetical protein
MRERRGRERGGELEGYGGLLGRTRRAPVLLTEDDGSAEVRWVYRGVNAATDPALAELARRGELLRIDRASGLDLSFVYHDPVARKFALVLPEGIRHRALEERAALIRSFGEEPEHPVPSYVAEARVVIGLDALERYLVEAPEAPESTRVRRHAMMPSEAFDRELPRAPRAPSLDEARSREIALDPFEEMDELSPTAIEGMLRELVAKGEAGVPALLAALGSESSVVRLAAAIGLSRCPSGEVAVRMIDALIEEPTGVYRHVARLIASLGGVGLAAARAAAEDAREPSEPLVLAFGHLAEAGFDLEIERLTREPDGSLGEIARRGLDAIVDARDAVALMAGPPSAQRDPIDRLAARFETALEN